MHEVHSVSRRSSRKEGRLLRVREYDHLLLELLVSGAADRYIKSLIRSMGARVKDGIDTLIHITASLPLSGVRIVAVRCINCAREEESSWYIRCSR